MISSFLLVHSRTTALDSWQQWLWRIGEDDVL
jgi:hypothetical protein